MEKEFKLSNTSPVAIDFEISVTEDLMNSIINEQAVRELLITPNEGTVEPHREAKIMVLRLLFKIYIMHCNTFSGITNM